MKPRTLILYLTKRCDSRCPHCQWLLHDSSFFEVSKSTDMTLDRAKEIVSFYRKAGAKDVRLQAEGEIFLYEHFEELTLYCEKIGYKISGLPTNGIKLDKHAEFIVDHFPSLMVSVDGYDAETFIATRGGTEATFNKVTSNIKEAVRLKKQKKSKIQIGINCVITNKDFQKVSPMIKLSEQLGIDRLRFSNYHAIKGGDGLAPVSEKDLRRFKKDIQNSNVRVSLPKFHNKKPPFDCSQLFGAVLIGADGSYAPCCRIDSSSTWGNYCEDEKHNSTGLTQLRKRFRAAKKISDLPQICQICSRLRGSK